MASRFEKWKQTYPAGTLEEFNKQVANIKEKYSNKVAYKIGLDNVVITIPSEEADHQTHRELYMEFMAP